jgi:hypothetical protein
MSIRHGTDNPNVFTGLYENIHIGNMAPNDPTQVSTEGELVIIELPADPKSRQVTYQISASAQNGTSIQHLFFRRHKDGKPGWEYSYLVHRRTYSSRIINGIKTKVFEMRPVMRQGWSDEGFVGQWIGIRGPA